MVTEDAEPQPPVTLGAQPLSHSCINLSWLPWNPSKKFTKHELVVHVPHLQGGGGHTEKTFTCSGGDFNFACGALPSHSSIKRYSIRARNRWGWSQPAHWSGTVACLPLFMGWGAGVSQPWAYKRAIDFQHLDTRKCRQGPSEVRFSNSISALIMNIHCPKSHVCMCLV
jgi:hypothetical protein